MPPQFPRPDPTVLVAQSPHRRVPARGNARLVAITVPTIPGSSRVKDGLCLPSGRSQSPSERARWRSPRPIGGPGRRPRQRGCQCPSPDFPAHGRAPRPIVRRCGLWGTAQPVTSERGERHKAPSFDLCHFGTMVEPAAGHRRQGRSSPSPGRSGRGTGSDPVRLLQANGWRPARGGLDRERSVNVRQPWRRPRRRSPPAADLNGGGSRSAPAAWTGRAPFGLAHRLAFA